MLEIQMPAVGGRPTTRMNAWGARNTGCHGLRLSSAGRERSALEYNCCPPLARCRSARRHHQGGHRIRSIQRGELHGRPRAGQHEQ